MRRKHRVQEVHIHKQNSKNSFALKMSAFVLFVLMLSANIVIFAQSVSLSDKLVTLETETRELQKENARLEQKVYTETSLSNLQELADQLGFTKKAEPIHLDTNEFALVP